MLSDTSAAAALRRARSPALSRRPWLKTGARTLSFGELCDRIDRIGGLLAANGVRTGDRVVTALTDDMDGSVLAVALICHGVALVNLDPAVQPDRAQALAARARPALIIADQALCEVWGLTSGPAPVLALPSKAPARSGLASLLGQQQTGGLEALIREARPVSPPETLDPETIAYILFTSGTTSQSKGVAISHRALFSHLDTLIRLYGLSAESRIMNTLMLSHADGVVQGPILAFAGGAAVHRPMTFEIGAIERYLDAIYQLRITHLVAVPTMLSLILKMGAGQADAFQGGDFRLLVSCGAQLEPGLWHAFEDTFKVPIINVYGLTETVAGGVFAGPGLGTGARGAIGVPVDCELRIVDEAGAVAPPGEAGELLIRGSLLMSGYFDDEERTAEALQDGWLLTGDIARQDQAGDYWICGRKKSVIIRGGLNIHPEEIVEVLNRSPLVGEAVAFGEPDPDWGETLTAVVAAAGEVREEVLLDHCRRHLEPRKVPSRIVIVAALPKGRSGKVVLEEARQLARAPAPVRAQKDGGVEDRVLAAAAQTFGLEQGRLSLNDTPETVVGWDSLAHLNLVFAIEKAFGVRLTPKEIMSLDSLGKIVTVVRGR